MAPEVANGRPVEILLVEDNENDVIITREGLRMGKLANNLHHVSNGKEAMAFLRKEGQYENAPTPDLILLDLNMPIMSGHEVMEEISKDEALVHLPVVVLTTSDNHADILELYKLRCSSYVTKPVGFDSFVQIVGQLTGYWFSIVKLPPEE